MSALVGHNRLATFAPLYSKDNGRMAKPIRLMLSFLILKQLRNVSDESVLERFLENAYFFRTAAHARTCDSPFYSEKVTRKFLCLVEKMNGLVRMVVIA